MNINVGEYLADGWSLATEIDDHQQVMSRNTSLPLTGRVALVSDPETGSLGAMQVWSEVADDTWVYVNVDGEIISAACPIQSAP